jgi:hypothetical protein
MEQIPHIAFSSWRCGVVGCTERAYRAERCREHYSQYVAKRATETSDWFIYAIRAPNNLIKLGRAKNPTERLAALQIGSPVKLTLIAWARARWSLEGKVHKLLAESREHGEWFRPDDPVLQIVELIADQDTDEIERITSPLA